MSGIILKLITGRTLDQGKALETGKFARDYKESTAICEIDSGDLRKLSVKSGSNIKVKTAYGEVVVRAVASKASHAGVIFIPMGPWANAVTDSNTHGSGMPTLKGIQATLESTSEPVPSIVDLIREVSRKSVKVRISSSAAPSSSEYTLSNVGCSFCGCVCDDIEITVKDSKIVRAKRACPIGMTKFLNYQLERQTKPIVRKQGKLVETSIDEAINMAADILVNAKYPILYGWSSTSNGAMRLGVELAELVGCVVDNTAVMCHGPTFLGTHQTGIVTATLGQIKNRADLIVYWGCNPANAHLRHMIRYSALAKGRFVPEGRKGRKVIAVDVRPTSTSKMADMFVRVDSGMDYELLTSLRMALKDYEIEAPSVAGVDRETIIEMADMLMSAKFGVIFFGVGITMSVGKNRNVEEAIKLVQDLNEWTKFVIMPMRGHFNVAGTNAVMTWLTGFPYAIDFSRGYPIYDPGITTVTDILARGEADAALIVASDPVSHFPRDLVERLSSIPTIVIDPRWTPTATIADVFIPSVYIGIECEGTVYRMDKVPLRLKKVVDPPQEVLSDEELLTMLIERVREKIRR